MTQRCTQCRDCWEKGEIEAVQSKLKVMAFDVVSEAFIPGKEKEQETENEGCAQQTEQFDLAEAKRSRR